VQEEEPGAVASAPVDGPTEAAVLHIVLLPDICGEDHWAGMRGTISASWARLRRAIDPPGSGGSHH
jgi:hypothetical protein